MPIKACDERDRCPKVMVLCKKKAYSLNKRNEKTTEEVGMPGLATMTIVGVIVLAVLFIVFMRVRQQDLLGEIMQKRKGSSKLVSRADYVEGVEKIPVVLALTGDTFYYENMDLQASFELERIDEIDYDDDLATGRSHHADARVLRLRSHGAAFEFLVDKSEIEKWKAQLPPRRLEGSQAVAG
jgi:hypothetical protein